MTARSTRSSKGTSGEPIVSSRIVVKISNRLGKPFVAALWFHRHDQTVLIGRDVVKKLLEFADNRRDSRGKCFERCDGTCFALRGEGGVDVVATRTNVPCEFLRITDKPRELDSVGITDRLDNLFSVALATSAKVSIDVANDEQSPRRVIAPEKFDGSREFNNTLLRVNPARKTDSTRITRARDGMEHFGIDWIGDPSNLVALVVGQFLANQIGNVTRNGADSIGVLVEPHLPLWHSSDMYVKGTPRSFPSEQRGEPEAVGESDVRRRKCLSSTSGIGTVAKRVKPTRSKSPCRRQRNIPHAIDDALLRKVRVVAANDRDLVPALCE